MAKPIKLELTWIRKENRPKQEPRILLEDAEKSYHAKHRGNVFEHCGDVLDKNKLAIRIVYNLWNLESLQFLVFGS